MFIINITKLQKPIFKTKYNYLFKTFKFSKTELNGQQQIVIVNSN